MKANPVCTGAVGLVIGIVEFIGILDIAAATGFPALHASNWIAPPEEQQRFYKQLLSCDDHSLQ